MASEVGSGPDSSLGAASTATSTTTERNQTLRAATAMAQKGVSISTECSNMINELACSQDVFLDCTDEIKHVCTILAQRSQSHGRSDQLKFLCERYVKRYTKRMEILQRYGGQQVSEQNLGTAAKIKIFLERPFASRPATVFFIFLSLIVCLSSGLVVLQSIPSFNPIIFEELESYWFLADVGASAVFLLEVIIRCVVTTLDTRYKPWNRNFIDFFKSPSNLLDISACLLPVPAQVYGREYSFLNVFRLLRMFRVFYFLRHFEAFEDLEVTLLKSAPSLSGPLIALLVGLVGFASIIFTFEQGSYDDINKMFMVRDEDCEDSAPHVLGKVECVRSESLFLSAVHSMWFVLITFLQVGYGDMVPLTFSGRFIGSVTIIAGSLFMAMPIAIVGTNFTIAVDRLRQERRNVRAMLARRQYLSEERLGKAMETIHRPAVLPSLAFCRFLRLTLKQDHLELNNLTKRVPYYIDLYLERFVVNLTDTTKAERARKLSARAAMERKPFSSKLTLIRRDLGPLGTGFSGALLEARRDSFAADGGTITMPSPYPCVLDKAKVIPLNQALTVKIGSGRDCLIRLVHDKSVTTKLLHYAAKHNEWKYGLEMYLTSLNRENTLYSYTGGDSSIDPAVLAAQRVAAENSMLKPMLQYYAESECGSGDARMIGEHHASLSLVNFGGEYDRLYLVPVQPFSTMVGSMRTAKTSNVELSRHGESTVVRFDPNATESSDGVQLVVKKGTDYSVISQIAQPQLFEPPKLPKSSAADVASNSGGGLKNKSSSPSREGLSAPAKAPINMDYL